MAKNFLSGLTGSTPELKFKSTLVPRFIGWHGENPSMGKREKIPKKIWTYWNTEEIPGTVLACMQSWRETNPDYDVCLITPKTLDHTVDDIPKEFYSASPQRQADWVRVALLCQHGGVWMDSTTIAYRSLEYIQQLHEVHSSDLIAYYNKSLTKDSFYPIIENWFIAAPKNSKFIKDWYEQFDISIRLGANEYIKLTTKVFSIDTLRQNLHSPTYFSMHIAAQFLLRSKNNYSLTLMPAENDAFKVARDYDWNLTRIAKAMCVDPETNPNCNIFKMIGKVWRPIHEEVSAGRFTEKSLIGRLLASSAKSKTVSIPSAEQSDH